MQHTPYEIKEDRLEIRDGFQVLQGSQLIADNQPEYPVLEMA